MAGFESDLTPTRRGRGDGSQADAPCTDDRDALAARDPGHLHPVDRHCDRLDEAGLFYRESGGEGDQRVAAHEHPLGEPTVAPHAEGDVVAAEMPQPTRAQRADTAS